MKLLDFLTAGLCGVGFALLCIATAQGIFHYHEFLVGGGFLIAAFVYSITRG
jgi:hypothetical protein